MARKSELISKRNRAIRRRLLELERENFQWKYEALIAAVAEEFFLAPRTIKAIVNEEAMYKVSA